MNLRESLTIFRYTEAADGSGNIEEARENLKDTRGDVVPLSEKRAAEQGQIVGNRPFQIFIRFHSYPELNNDMFLEWEGKELTIHSVIPIQARNTYFEIIAFEKS